MKTIKKITVYLIISTLIICCSSCSKSDVNNLVFPEKGKNGALFAESGYCGDTIQEMYELSANVIIGKVTENGVIDEKYYKDSVYANVCIEKTLKGELKPNDIIKVADIAVIQDGMEITIDGVPLLKKGMRVMLFLTNASKGKLETEVEFYSIMGATAGRFFCDKNNKFHSVKEFTDTETYTVSDGDTPFSEEQAVQNFNASANK